VPVREKTFEDQDLRRDRHTIACSNSAKNCTGRWEGGCGLFSSLKRCYCKSKVDFFGAFPDIKKGVFRCRKYRCPFKQLIEQGDDLRESEDSSIEDEYDLNDGFLVGDDEPVE
jgi:hypothetical protein